MSKAAATRLAVIGTGLLGGSFALRARQRGLVKEIVGCDLDPAAGAEAVRLGIADRHEPDPLLAVAGADLVLVATPPRDIPAVLTCIAPALAPGALCMDVGSTKRFLLDLAWTGAGHLVGAHPMAGTEQTGPSAAKASLFDGAVTLLTPTAATDPGALARARSLWEALGVAVREMDPAVHDEVMATVSHLPHLVAYALCCVAYDRHERRPEMAGLFGGGFKDTSRIAATPPRLWRDVFELNKDNLLADLDRYAACLAALRGKIEGDRWDEVVVDLEHARAGRSFVLGGKT